MQLNLRRALGGSHAVLRGPAIMVMVIRLIVRMRYSVDLASDLARYTSPGLVAGRIGRIRHAGEGNWQGALPFQCEVCFVFSEWVEGIPA